jgi:voltage-gated potassium channel
MTVQTRLERFQSRTEWPLAGVALVFLVLYSVKVLLRPAGDGGVALDYLLIAVYLLFVADYLARLYLAEPRAKWFVRHIFDFLIVALPFLRPLRLLSLAVMLDALQRAVGHSIRGKVVVYTACGAVLIVYAASLAVFDLERDHPDGKIKTFTDALWWSMTTVTTVGYGDLWPVTGWGRLVAACLMIGGISLVGLVTATLASWIVQRVAEEDDANQAATHAEIEELRDEIRRLTNSMTPEVRPAYGDDGGRMEGSG